MFVTPAYAQTTGTTPDMLISILPFVLIFVIMYFLIIRPQRTQMKKRQEMLNNVRRGDTVVTGGGLVAKVTKVNDNGELELDLGNGIKVTAVRATLAEVTFIASTCGRTFSITGRGCTTPFAMPSRMFTIAWSIQTT